MNYKRRAYRVDVPLSAPTNVLASIPRRNIYHIGNWSHWVRYIALELYMGRYDQTDVYTSIEETMSVVCVYFIKKISSKILLIVSLEIYGHQQFSE